MAAGISRAPKQENVSSTLSSGITDVAGSGDVADASKFNFPSYLMIDRVDSSGVLKSTSLWELVKVTNIASNTLSITRGQGGTTAQAHSAGAVVEAVVSAAQFEEWYAALNPEHTSAGAHTMDTPTANFLDTKQLAVTSVASIAALFAGNITATNLAAGSFPGSRGQFVWTSAGAFATSLATAPTDNHLPFLRASKNLTINDVWAGVNSAPSLTFAEFTLQYKSAPSTAFAELLTQHLFIDIGENVSNSAATAATLALTSLASGTLLYPSVMKTGSAGDLTLTVSATER